MPRPPHRRRTDAALAPVPSAIVPAEDVGLFLVKLEAAAERYEMQRAIREAA
jgi:hypothetical protein